MEAALESGAGRGGAGPAPVAAALQEAARTRRGTREEVSILFVALMRALSLLARSVRWVPCCPVTTSPLASGACTRLRPESGLICRAQGIAGENPACASREMCIEMNDGNLPSWCISVRPSKRQELSAC